jgi:hypothetical protein
VDKIGTKINMIFVFIGYLFILIITIDPIFYFQIFHYPISNTTTTTASIFGNFEIEENKIFYLLREAISEKKGDLIVFLSLNFLAGFTG